MVRTGRGQIRMGRAARRSTGVGRKVQADCGGRAEHRRPAAARRDQCSRRVTVDRPVVVVVVVGASGVRA